MRYSLLSGFDLMPPLNTQLDNLLLLGIGFLILIFWLIVGAIMLNSFSKAYASSADQPKHKSAKRKHKRSHTTLCKHQPSTLLSVAESNSVQTATSPAHNALRRNAEASTAHKEDVAIAHTRPNIHLVKQKERA